MTCPGTATKRCAAATAPSPLQCPHPCDHNARHAIVRPNKWQANSPSNSSRSSELLLLRHLEPHAYQSLTSPTVALRSCVGGTYRLWFPSPSTCESDGPAALGRSGRGPAQDGDSIDNTIHFSHYIDGGRSRTLGRRAGRLQQRRLEQQGDSSKNEVCPGQGRYVQERGRLLCRVLVRPDARTDRQRRPLGGEGSEQRQASHQVRSQRQLTSTRIAGTAPVEMVDVVEMSRETLWCSTFRPCCRPVSTGWTPV